MGRGAEKRGCWTGAHCRVILAQPWGFCLFFCFSFFLRFTFPAVRGDGMWHAGWSLGKSFIEALPFARFARTNAAPKFLEGSRPSGCTCTSSVHKGG